MSAYNQEFNYDNTIIRYIIVALLAELKDKVYYYNQIDAETLKKIPVPFFYSITGDGRFLMDNFLYDAEAAGKAIGDYEVVPRGILQLTGISIDSGNQTNKFVRSEFVREWEGVLKTFSLETNFLPLTMTFSTTIVCSDNLEMLKVTESLIDFMTKEAIVANPKAAGVGMLRSGKDNELGIYFGGIFQKFNMSQQSLLKVQPSSTFSNQGYINPDSIQTGGSFSESSITSSA